MLVHGFDLLGGLLLPLCACHGSASSVFVHLGEGSRIPGRLKCDEGPKVWGEEGME